MRRASLLAGVLVFSTTFPVCETEATTRRKECRPACSAAIDACVAAGGKRRKCNRQTLKRCRQEGTIVCASSSTTSTTTSPGGTSTTSEVTTTTGPNVTTSTLASVNGCTYADALDRTAPANFRTIVFVFPYYSPACMRIAAGQTAIFQGDFATHPLVGGTIVAMTKMPDPASPIPPTSSGTSLSVMFPSAGVFPYYCDMHGAMYGMYGVVYVDP
jgi:plastocyanin